MLAHQLGNGVDGSGDQLAFEHDHVGRVALQRKVQIVEVFYLRDDANVVFESEDLADSNTVDGLRIGKDDANSRRAWGLLKRVLLRLLVLTPGFVKMNNRHKSGL